MREIKFRALVDGKIVMPGATIGIGSGSEIIEIGLNGVVSRRNAFGLDGFSRNPDFDEPESSVLLMQYTGMKDSNGVEIYEGDICDGHSDGIGVIEWTDYDGGYHYRFEDTEVVGISEVKDYLVVIGNIHENPELLL